MQRESSHWENPKEICQIWLFYILSSVSLFENVISSLSKTFEGLARKAFPFHTNRERVKIRSILSPNPESDQIRK